MTIDLGPPMIGFKIVESLHLVEEESFDVKRTWEGYSPDPGSLSGPPRLKFAWFPVEM
jgi:hypothetical protein